MPKIEEFDVLLQFEDKLIVQLQKASGLKQVIHQTLNDALHYRDLKYIHMIDIERPLGPLT